MIVWWLTLRTQLERVRALEDALRVALPWVGVTPSTEIAATRLRQDRELIEERMKGASWFSQQASAS